MTPNENTPAHPAARIIADLSNRAIDRQISQLNDLDLKASFLGGATVALLAGFLTALATKAPATQRSEDIAVATLVFLAVTLASTAFTWWPRSVDVPPHPRGLRERHWAEPEEAVLRAVADAIATTYDVNRKVEFAKVFGVRLAIFSLGIGVVLGSIDILLNIGGIH